MKAKGTPWQQKHRWTTAGRGSINEPPLPPQQLCPSLRPRVSVQCSVLVHQRSLSHRSLLFLSLFFIASYVYHHLAFIINFFNNLPSSSLSTCLLLPVTSTL